MKNIGCTYSVSLPEPPIGSVRTKDYAIDHATKVWIDGELVWQTGDPGTAAQAAYKAMFCAPAQPEREAMSEPCCTVSLSGADHFPRGITWYVEWLPKGYGPSLDDRLVCAFPDQGWTEQGYGLGVGDRPPVIEVVCAAIDKLWADRARFEGVPDFAMTEARAREIIAKADWHGSEYADKDGTPRVQLDGSFTADELEAFAWWLRNKAGETP